MNLDLGNVGIFDKLDQFFYFSDVHGVSSLENWCGCRIAELRDSLLAKTWQDGFQGQQIAVNPQAADDAFGYI